MTIEPPGLRTRTPSYWVLGPSGSVIHLMPTSKVEPPGLGIPSLGTLVLGTPGLGTPSLRTPHGWKSTLGFELPRLRIVDV